MTLAPDAMLGMAMRFEVAVDGVDLGGWATCKGLAVIFDPEEIKELGGNEFVTYLAGQVTYPKVILTRALTAPDSAKVMSWLSRQVSRYKGGTAQITLLDAHLDKVAAWSLRNVYPLAWKGPALDASGNNIAIETLELVHEGFLDE